MVNDIVSQIEDLQICKDDPRTAKASERTMNQVTTKACCGPSSHGICSGGTAARSRGMAIAAEARGGEHQQIHAVIAG